MNKCNRCGVDLAILSYCTIPSCPNTPSTKEEKTGGEVEEDLWKTNAGELLMANHPSKQPSIPLTDTDFEKEAEELLIKHLTPIYGAGESTIMAKLEKNKCVISAIMEARQMSLPNKKSAEMIWDACIERESYEYDKEEIGMTDETLMIRYSGKIPPDKQTFLSSLPEQNESVVSQSKWKWDIHFRTLFDNQETMDEFFKELMKEMNIATTNGMFEILKVNDNPISFTALPVPKRFEPRQRPNSSRARLMPRIPDPITYTIRFEKFEEKSSSLPDTDKMGELIEWVEICKKNGWTIISIHDILSKAKEINSKSK